MAKALHPGIENDRQHQEQVANEWQQRRDKVYGALVTGFWGGLVLGMAATAGLVATYFLKY